MSERPVILISALNTETKSVTAAMAAIRAAGAEPMLIANHAARLGGRVDAEAIRKSVEMDLEKADGVMVMGNDRDIDPKDYKATSVHPETKSERATPEGAVRAAYEYTLLSETLKCGKPLVGVCAGMQRLNVLLGGSLHQHVPDLTGNQTHDQSKADVAPFVPVVYVKPEAGSALSQLSDGKGQYTPAHHQPAGIVMENSFHHQSIDEVGQGLKASAYSVEPGSSVRIVEAVEADPQVMGNRFVMGVQWHPEFGASELSAKLLNNFTEKSAQYAREHPRVSPALAETARSMAAPRWQHYVRKSQEAAQSQSQSGVPSR